MPADRTQLATERIEALTEALVAEGVLSRDWADAVQQTEQIGDGRAVAEAAREGRGPPDHNAGNGGA